ncbi:hypothetical protein ERAQ111492_00540 [Erysipelothrix aquatica]|uniref:hypothetical protein n=1 Tax=Erysipelothrix aquatica TaxID=2683714 RepID=UPI001F2C00EA|nr:hypothetical protein [Erysipelothrix aquatica]
MELIVTFLMLFLSTNEQKKRELEFSRNRLITSIIIRSTFLVIFAVIAGLGLYWSVTASPINMYEVFAALVVLFFSLYYFIVKNYTSLNILKKKES